MRFCPPLLPGAFLLLAIAIAPAQAEVAVVLPYFNLTKSKNLDWVGESISETLSEALAGAGVLSVERDERNEGMRRLSVKRYAQLAEGTVMEIAMNLDADTAVFGEFHTPSAGQIVIVTRIANLKRIKRHPDISEQGSFEQLSSLQSRVAWRVLYTLRPDATPILEEYLQRDRPIRLDALEGYTRGLLATDFDQRHRLFANAAFVEPTFSLPSYQLGLMQFQRKDYRAAADWFQKVQSSNSRYRESQFYLGLSTYYSGDFMTARRAFEYVAGQVPLAEVVNNLGAAELRLGAPQALQHFQQALEIDPDDPAYHFNTGYALWRSGDFDSAAERFRSTLARSPNDQTATLLLGRCLKKSGPRPGDVRTEGQERLKRNYGETAWRHLKAVLQQ